MTPEQKASLIIDYNDKLKKIAEHLDKFSQVEQLVLTNMNNFLNLFYVSVEVMHEHLASQLGSKQPVARKPINSDFEILELSIQGNDIVIEPYNIVALSDDKFRTRGETEIAGRGGLCGRITVFYKRTDWKEYAGVGNLYIFAGDIFYGSGPLLRGTQGSISNDKDINDVAYRIFKKVTTGVNEIHYPAESIEFKAPRRNKIGFNFEES